MNLKQNVWLNRADFLQNPKVATRSQSVPKYPLVFMWIVLACTLQKVTNYASSTGTIRRYLLQLLVSKRRLWDQTRRRSRAIIRGVMIHQLPFGSEIVHSSCRWNLQSIDNLPCSQLKKKKDLCIYLTHENNKNPWIIASWFVMSL